jgi:hypothetical protein
MHIRIVADGFNYSYRSRAHANSYYSLGSRWQCEMRNGKHENTVVIKTKHISTRARTYCRASRLILGFAVALLRSQAANLEVLAELGAPGTASAKHYKPPQSRIRGYGSCKRIHLEKQTIRRHHVKLRAANTHRVRLHCSGCMQSVCSHII